MKKSSKRQKFLISILIDALFDKKIMKIAKEKNCDVDIATLIQCIEFIKEIFYILSRKTHTKLFSLNHVS